MDFFRVHPQFLKQGRLTWMARKGIRLLGAIVVLLLTVFLLTIIRESRTPDSPPGPCAPDPLSGQADPDHLALYFTPRPRPVTKLASRYLLQPHPRTCSSRLDLLIVVPSTPDSASGRDVIRKTWGSVVTKPWPGSNMKKKVGLMFMLGKKDHHSFDFTTLQKEADTHGDLIIGDFIDSYRNLTLKMLTALNWVSSRCSHRVSYVMKTDQDTFVRVDLILDILSKLPLHSASNTMLGELLCDEPVNRDAESPVYVNTIDYPFSTYPPYVRGGTYIISGELIAPLLNASRHMPLLPVEDAFINGVVARTLHVRHVDVPGVMKPFVCSLSPCLFWGTGQVSATDVDFPMMQAIWQQLQDGLQQCDNLASWWTRSCVWFSNTFA